MLTRTTSHVYQPLPPEICARCGHPISGKEMPQIWRERIVCSICREQLQDQQLIFRAFGKRVAPISNGGSR